MAVQEALQHLYSGLPWLISATWETHLEGVLGLSGGSKRFLLFDRANKRDLIL